MPSGFTLKLVVADMNALLSPFAEFTEATNRLTTVLEPLIWDAVILQLTEPCPEFVRMEALAVTIITPGLGGSNLLPA